MKADRVVWQGKWRDMLASFGRHVARVRFQPPGGHWTLRVDGKPTSKHDSRAAALRAGAKALRALHAADGGGR